MASEQEGRFCLGEELILLTESICVLVLHLTLPGWEACSFSCLSRQATSAPPLGLCISALHAACMRCL